MKAIHYFCTSHEQVETFLIHKPEYARSSFGRKGENMFENPRTNLKKRKSTPAMRRAWRLIELAQILREENGHLWIERRQNLLDADHFEEMAHALVKRIQAGRRIAGGLDEFETDHFDIWPIGERIV